SILMLSFVFLGLKMMGDVRDQALSDPAACHVIASARDIASPGSAGVELTPQLLAVMNRAAPWSNWTRPRTSGQASGVAAEAAPAEDLNPCGEAPDLVFGRNTTELTLGILNQNNACIRINVEPKTLVANFREPTIMATKVELLSGP